MNKLLLIVLFLAGCFSVGAQVVKGPAQLRVNLLLGPDDTWNNGEKATRFGAIFTKRPRFDWQSDTAIKKIGAYRILVATSPALLVRNAADYWDSEKITSPFSHATYGGISLDPGQTYYWKVQVWDDKNTVSAYSEVASFKINKPVSADTISRYLVTFEKQSPVGMINRKLGSWLFDFGKDAFGQLEFHLDIEKNDTLIVEVGEMADNDMVSANAGKSIRYTRIKLPVIKGIRDYNIFWPADHQRNSRNPVQVPANIGEVFPFRYVSIENYPGFVNSGSVKRKMVHYPFADEASTFVSSDTVLNKVWELCKYSVKATSFCGYYVDGDRERIPYEADAFINQLSHYAVDAEYSMARRTIAHLLAHPTWPTEWSLQNVLLAWNDYMYTGDPSFLRTYYAELRRKTLTPLADTSGLISTRTGKQTDKFLISLHKKDFDGRHGFEDIVDWPQTGVVGPEKENPGETDGFIYTKYNSVVNAFYYRNLVLMEKIARVLNKDMDAEAYRVSAAKVMRSYQRVFRDEVNGLIKDGDETNHSSIHSNMFALAFGMIPAADMQKVAAYIKTRKMACSVYGAQFLLDALYEAGQDQYALELMTATTVRSWYNMIRSGSTISMEAWDKLYKPNLDLNHAWGTAPANIIVRKLMGIEPLTPGFETIRIKPMIGNLAFAKLTTLTIKGEVSVSCEKNGEGEKVDIIVPGATTANIYLPAGADSKLLIEGAYQPIRSTNGFFVIENVPAGKHSYAIR